MKKSKVMYLLIKKENFLWDKKLSNYVDITQGKDDEPIITFNKEELIKEFNSYMEANINVIYSSKGNPNITINYDVVNKGA